MNANNTLQDATTPYTECCIPLGFEKTKQLLPEISSTLVIVFTKTLFKKLLLSLQDKTMEEPTVVIDETFETWKGNLEQIDDVCVIGVRI
jgi:hypothetical protein